MYVMMIFNWLECFVGFIVYVFMCDKFLFLCVYVKFIIYVRMKKRILM